MPGSRPATTEPAVERDDQKQILSGGNRGRLEASILASSGSWSRAGRLALPLVKKSKEQASGNIAFHRVLFGLAPSPFLLAAVIKEHLQLYKSVNPKLVEETERSMYVDDLITGG